MSGNLDYIMDGWPVTIDEPRPRFLVKNLKHHRVDLRDVRKGDVLFDDHILFRVAKVEVDGDFLVFHDTSGKTEHIEATCTGYYILDRSILLGD